MAQTFLGHMHRKVAAICLLGAVHISSTDATWASDHQVEAYGEVSTLEESGWTSNTHLRVLKEISDTRIFPFLGFSLETYHPPSVSLRRLSPLFGLERKFGPIRLFAEHRYAFESPVSSYSRHDPRLGATGGYWQSDLFSIPKLFTDSYGELISIPRINWNPNLVIQSKIGWREPFRTNIFFDPYFEAYFKDSADPAMGRDAFQIRGGLRIVYVADKWSASLTAYHRIHSFKNEPNNKINFLLAMGANL